MENYSHIDHKVTRDVLLSVTTDKASIEDALSFADECLQADQHDEDVTEKMYRIRASALQSAYDRWEENGDVIGTIESLKVFWMN